MRRIYPAMLVASALMASPHTAHALRIDYVVDLAMERSDNLLLTETDPVALNTLQPSIGFDINHDSSALQTHVSGRIENRRYGDDRFDDTVDGALTGRIDWVAIPDRLRFTAIDSLALQPVDPLTPDTPGNRQQVNVLSAGPTLDFEWGANWRGAAELRYVRSDAEITDQFNSSRIDLTLRTIKRLSATSRIAVNVQTQRVDFQSDANARDYARSELFARYTRKLSRFDLSLDLGYAVLDYRRDLASFIGRRSDPLLRTELTWRPNPSHRLAARFSRQFSDVAADSLTNVGEGSGIPTEIVTGDAIVNASPYLERQFVVRYAYTATRWSFGVSPYTGRRRYPDIGTFDQRDDGGNIEASWRARRNLQLGFTGALKRIDYVNLDREEDTRRYSGYVRYDWARRWSGTVSLGRYTRDSSVVGQSVHQNVVGLTFSYRNR